MIYSIHSQRYMVQRSYILVSLILSSCSLEYGVKEYLIDSEGYGGISTFWDNSGCPIIWSVSINDISTCFPKKPEEKANCIVLSLPYKINEVREIYMNIQTETRACATLKSDINCTGKFSLSVNYLINGNDVKRVILPDEIPLNIYNKKIGGFIDTNDTVSFSVDRNYSNLKLGFQAPYYCGSLKSVSVYYYLCPTKTSALVDFPEVPAPSKISSPYSFFGTCTRNALRKSISRYLSMNCYYNGTGEVFGGCECESGYTKNKNLCEGEWFS